MPKYRTYFFKHAGSQCSWTSPTTLKTSTPYAYTYTVKVINREKKSDYSVQKLPSFTKFSPIEELKDSFHRGLEIVPSEFGLTEPGHSLKGRLRWMHDDADLDKMYNDYPKKLAWCYTALNQMDDAKPQKACGHKQATPAEAAAPTPKAKSTCVRKVNKVEEIIKELRDKHGTNFNVEQFSIWAHVIHIGKHFT